VTDPFPSGDFAFGRFVVQSDLRQLLIDGESVSAGADAAIPERGTLNAALCPLASITGA